MTTLHPKTKDNTRFENPLVKTIKETTKSENANLNKS